MCQRSRFDQFRQRASRYLAIVLPAVLVSCGNDVANVKASVLRDGHNENPNEVITTVKLTFTPSNGDAPIEALWSDPGLSGSPRIDGITLLNGLSYILRVEVHNELEDPVEDITPEIFDELDEHQLFYFGNAIVGPSNQSNPDAVLEHFYDDSDSNGLPVGLRNTFVAKGTGVGVMGVLMQHMPMLNGTLIKEDDLEALMNDQGKEFLPGSSDFLVEFNVVVQ